MNKRRQSWEFSTAQLQSLTTVVGCIISVIWARQSYTPSPQEAAIVLVMLGQKLLPLGREVPHRDKSTDDSSDGVERRRSRMEVERGSEDVDTHHDRSLRSRGWSRRGHLCQLQQRPVT